MVGFKTDGRRWMASLDAVEVYVQECENISEGKRSWR